LAADDENLQFRFQEEFRRIASTNSVGGFDLINDEVGDLAELEILSTKNDLPVFTPSKDVNN
jgi:hypothetical protein